MEFERQTLKKSKRRKFAEQVRRCIASILPDLGVRGLVLRKTVTPPPPVEVTLQIWPMQIFRTIASPMPSP